MNDNNGGYGRQGGSDRGGYHKGGDRGHGGYGGNRGGFRKGGSGRGGFHKHDDRRDFHRDGDRRDFKRGGDFKRDDRRDGGRRFDRDDRRSGGKRFDRDDRRDFHRDGDRRDFHRDGDRRDFKRDDRREGGNPRYAHDDRRSFRGDRDGDRGFRRDDRERTNHDSYEKGRGDSRDFQREHRFRRDSDANYRGGRRNSDGTVSYPSQNPYKARRPNEPVMPEGMMWNMLSEDERERLRGLSKEHAENIGLHILAADSLVDTDPKAALEHAKWVAHQASRVDFARETYALVAYRTGEYETALREFRTAYRMNGYPDYLPFMADCERALGHPEKAVELAMSEDAKRLTADSKAEMFIVYAGALGDLGKWDQAIEVIRRLSRSKGLPGPYRMRALQAEQNLLEQAGRAQEAQELEDTVETYEDEYADMDDEEIAEDTFIDNDLQLLNPEEMERTGIVTAEDILDAEEEERREAEERRAQREAEREAAEASDGEESAKASDTASDEGEASDDAASDDAEKADDATSEQADADDAADAETTAAAPAEAAAPAAPADAETTNGTDAA